MKHFLQKYFSGLQPLILCVVLVIISALIQSYWMPFVGYVLLLFFIAQIIINGKYFWEE